MALTRPIAVNPALEELRNDALRRENVDEPIFEYLVKQTHNLHVGFLFTKEGEEALKIIGLGVGETAEDSISPDWQYFANYLEINRQQMQNIKNHQFETINQGPVWRVIAIYAHRDDATIANIIRVLNKIERRDIITQVKDEICNLVRYVHSCVQEEDRNLGILRPKCVPRIALVLQPSRTELERARRVITIVNDISNAAEEFYGKIDDGDEKVKPLFFRIMLTFADDGAEAAKRIAKKLRSYRPRIGVVILEEQMSYLFGNPLEFVEVCLRQVDAVFPILTKGYFDTIYYGRNNNGSWGRDETYAKYIYDNLRGEFSQNNCLNKRVGSIIPEGQDYKLPLLTSTLRIYTNESCMKEFVTRILSTKMKERNYRKRA